MSYYKRTSVESLNVCFPRRVDVRRESRVHGHGPGRGRPELHLRLLGRTVSLAGIAGPTRGNDVAPLRLSTLGTREDVIQGQIQPVEPETTVLAFVPIPPVDTGPREPSLAFLPGVLPETYDRGEVDGTAHTLDLGIVDLDDLYFAEEVKRDGALPGDGADYLIRGIEKENSEMVGVIVHDGLQWDAEDEGIEPPDPFSGDQPFSKRSRRTSIRLSSRLKVQAVSKRIELLDPLRGPLSFQDSLADQCLAAHHSMG